MDKYYSEFLKTPIYQNWDKKDRMSIIYSPEMFTAFMKFYKMQTGKKLIIDSVNDMTLSRRDAMDRCIGLGKQFISHFDKIYKNKNSDDINHWIMEMNTFYKKVKEIKLKESNDEILSGDLRDWFFNAGANVKDFMKNSTYEEEKLYDNFVNKVINSNNIKSSLKEINIIDSIKDAISTKKIYKVNGCYVAAKDAIDAVKKYNETK